MKDAEFTPGPWVWGEDAFKPEAWAGVADEGTPKYATLQLYGELKYGIGVEVLSIRRDHQEVIWDGSMPNPADMHLIAAAPTLYEALKELVDRREQVGGTRPDTSIDGSDGRYARARAALALALGEVKGERA